MQEKRTTNTQELSAQNDRIEKLIANVLNNGNCGGYSKLKQIVKENVIVIILENNKKLIWVSFAV